MKKIANFLFVLILFALPTICWGQVTTTCSLQASSTQIIANQTVTWIVTSTPSGLPYVWHVDDPFGHTDVLGEGVTGWSGSYTYNTPGTYNAYFTIPQGPQNSPCTSDTISLTVNPVFLAGTNIFPSSGTFVQGQGIEIRTYSNVAPGFTLDWAVIVIDEQLVSAFSEPPTPLKLGWGITQQIGQHQIRFIIGTSAGQFETDADFQIISDDAATPQQIPAACNPLPSVGPISACTPVPPPSLP